MQLAAALLIACLVLGLQATPGTAATDAAVPAASTAASSAAEPTAKPKPGCCCLPSIKDRTQWSCSWGMTEPVCKSGADVFRAKFSWVEYKWTEGKCPSGE